MIDPSTIDMKMALEMTYGKYGEPLSLKCDKFPDVIDFDELEKIKPPRGYRVKVYSRDLKIEMSSFRGICPGSRPLLLQNQVQRPRPCKKERQFDGMRSRLAEDRKNLRFAKYGRK